MPCVPPWDPRDGLGGHWVNIVESGLGGGRLTTKARTSVPKPAWAPKPHFLGEGGETVSGKHNLHSLSYIAFYFTPI